MPVAGGGGAESDDDSDAASEGDGGGGFVSAEFGRDTAEGFGGELVRAAAAGDASENPECECAEDLNAEEPRPGQDSFLFWASFRPPFPPAVSHRLPL